MRSSEYIASESSKTRGDDANRMDSTKNYLSAILCMKNWWRRTLKMNLIATEEKLNKLKEELVEHCNKYPQLGEKAKKFSSESQE